MPIIILKILFALTIVIAEFNIYTKSHRETSSTTTHLKWVLKFVYEKEKKKECYEVEKIAVIE